MMWRMEKHVTSQFSVVKDVLHCEASILFMGEQEHKQSYADSQQEL